MDQEPQVPLQNNIPTPAPVQHPPLESFPKKRGPKALMVLSIVLLFLIAGAAFAYWKQQQKPIAQHTSPTTPDALNGNQLQPGDAHYPTTTPVTITAPDVSPQTPCKNPLPPIVSKFGSVQWINPELQDDALFATSSPNADFDSQDIYMVGHILSGNYAGGDVLFVKLYLNEPGGPLTYTVIRKDKKYYFLSDGSSAFPADSMGIIPVVSFAQDKNFSFSDLHFPNTISSDNPKASYALAPPTYGSRSDFFCADNLVKVFTDPNVGDVYTDAQIQYKDRYGNFVSTQQGFYVKYPDDTIAIYQLTISITGEDNVPLVVWSGGKKNTQEYTHQHIGGCGASNYRDVADVNLDILKQTGTAFDGSPVYEYKDSNTQELKDMYGFIYVPDGQAKLPYSSFIAAHPIFFWQDPFGKFIRFHNSIYQSMAECGKPVIYLYPQQTEKVSVELKPVGGFTHTEPVYGSGWNVIAKPDGSLTNIPDSKTYSYLFWEGRGGMYQTPSRGFVVEQKGVHEFLQAKLRELGLNAKEAADFMEFWEPKMQGSPYYFVTFMGNGVMDSIAPLSISPKPDTVIRILMDFMPLEQPISVQGFTIHAPERKGFTVVEWGGVLRNEQK